MMAGRNVERRLPGRVRRDRSDTLKGHKSLAQGFNPGPAVLTKCALKAAPVFGAPGRIDDLPRCRWVPNLLAPLSGRGSFATNPGLKPWAILFCPFGAFSPVTLMRFGFGTVFLHFSTPSLHVAGFEDEDENEALW
jgi:hypothetical protein